MKFSEDQSHRAKLPRQTEETLFTDTRVYIHTQSDSISSKMKRSADLTEPAVGSGAKDQADISVSPETTDRNPTGET